MSQKKNIEIDNILIIQEQYGEFPITVINTKGDIPVPRNDHRNIIKQKKLYLYGGTTDQNILDFYSLDLQTFTWKELKFDKKQGKYPVSGTSMIIWPSQTYPHLKPFSLLYGGWSGEQYSNELYLLNLTTRQMKPIKREQQKNNLEFEKPKSRLPVSIGNSKQIQKYQQFKYPPSRKDHTLSYIPSENKICLYGGWDGQFQTGGKEQLWILSSNWKWERYSGFSRRGHTSVVVDDENRHGIGILVFGGFRGVKAISNETLFFDIKKKIWNNIKQKDNQIPKGRAYHTANLIENKIIYVGGMNQNYEIFSEVWLFCLDKHQWSNLIFKSQYQPLLKRAGHNSFVLDKSTQQQILELYIFGGMTYRNNKYERMKMNEIVCLDLASLITTQTKQVIQEKPIIVHYKDHHWDLSAFGFFSKNKEPFQQQEFLKSIGITESEME